MISRHIKFVRFVNRTPSSEFTTEDGFCPRMGAPSLSSVLQSIQRRFGGGCERFRNLRNLSSNQPGSDQPENEPGSSKNILDPQGPLLPRWNKIFVLSCIIAVALDPLFFYVPVIDGKRKCLILDRGLVITACVLRSLVDLFYVLHIIFQFRTGFIAPSSRVFGRGELVDDPSAIAKRYMSSLFIIDILSVLPLPQFVVLVFANVRGPSSLAEKDLLKLAIFTQYVPRLMRIYPLYEEVTRTSVILTETAWGGAAYNLLLYMLASHVVGACWYLLSVEREQKCWLDICKRMNFDHHLPCRGSDDRGLGVIVQNITKFCSPKDPEDLKPNDFNYGIYTAALKFPILESKSFLEKFFFCFWWGLRNVSSLGQGLETSSFIGENIFAVFIAIFGLLFFALLIGNMQKYLQSTTVRVEEMRVKRRDAEHWMAHRMLPEDLRERIRRYEQYRWQENRGVQEETLICSFPKNLRRDIRRHLCLALLVRVPMFQGMDEQLLDAMCDHLRPVLFTEKSRVVREGDPVDMMLFIMRGKLASSYGGRSGIFNLVNLKPGDFCGEELLTWALDPNSSTILPNSTRTVESLTEVEAFALTADDLKSVASQFRRLHSKQLQNTFRFYSLQWRTWAACVIQATWHRYLRRKLERSLHEAEDRLQHALANNVGTSTSLIATIYASRFAANLLRAWRKNGPRRGRLSPRLPPLPPQRPPEPDFSS